MAEVYWWKMGGKSPEEPGEAGGSRRGAASHVDSFVLPIFLAHRTSPISGECPTPFREPLQFIVIAVMSVMSGTFPDTYGVFT
jgi:hypothetical protein